MERIAQDSLRDHVQIMEILTAYIRENAKAEDAKPLTDPDTGELIPEWESLPEDADSEAWAAHLEKRKDRFGSSFWDSKAWRWARRLKPRTDIQAAMYVIGRRRPKQIAEEKRDTRHNDNGFVLDLRLTSLQGCDLSGLELRFARLDEARLEGANLSGAKLEGAVLWKAKLEGADLRMAKLEGADLRGANLKGADLGGARLEGAYLGEAKLEGADLTGAQLEGADLKESKLEGANLRGARLKGADLSAAKLEGANLRGATFSDETNFAAAVVQYAAVKSVDMSRVQLDQDQVNSMFGDASVVLPEGFTRPVHWPDEDLEWPEFKKRWRAWQKSQGYEPG